MWGGLHTTWPLWPYSLHALRPSRVPDQNGVSQAWNIVEIYHSGWKPSNLYSLHTLRPYSLHALRPSRAQRLRPITILSQQLCGEFFKADKHTTYNPAAQCHSCTEWALPHPTTAKAYQVFYTQVLGRVGRGKRRRGWKNLGSRNYGNGEGEEQRGLVPQPNNYPTITDLENKFIPSPLQRPPPLPTSNMPSELDSTLHICCELECSVNPKRTLQGKF